jgi:protein-tyrosine phosphatase
MCGEPHARGAFRGPVGYLHQDVGYTDLHCHLLPGVDDGPSTLDESLAYAAAAAAAGTTTIVATPHVELVDVDELPERVDALRAALASEGIALDVRRGGELKPFSIPDLTDRELDLIAHGPPDARWVLYEVPFHGADEEFVAGAHELRARGFGLLLAHPERAADGHEHLWPLLEQGALLQVNVCSLLGNHGLDIQELAADFVRRGLAYCLASDGHPGTREHTLQLGFHLLLAAGASSAQAYRLTQSNPRFLLQQGIPSVDLEPVPASS